jgi:hypothetical protein
MALIRATWIIVAAVSFIACGGAAPGIRVTSAEYGDAWPFTIPEGTIECQRESARSGRLLVTLNDGKGIMYGLNGSAKTFGFPDGGEILKPGKVGVDVQPFIERGLTLCGQN